MINAKEYLDRRPNDIMCILGSKEIYVPIYVSDKNLENGHVKNKVGENPTFYVIIKLM